MELPNRYRFRVKGIQPKTDSSFICCQENNIELGQTFGSAVILISYCSIKLFAFGDKHKIAVSLITEHNHSSLHAVALELKHSMKTQKLILRFDFSVKSVSTKYMNHFRIQYPMRGLVREQKYDDVVEVLIHYDYASAHTARATQTVVENAEYTQLDHPPNSPDLVTCDFFI
ncbi:MAG: hypothetical protein EZS28_006664 [Streblomastix strix]|uniref:Uncharacterized protein n=1 Tax=Streblomastix strix TaxID=222440 RepID=A0A5J4WRS6_9EUKA|nr:MAG: hypothetical protein EZS28_006664 [Streblomastix strix]